MEEELALFQVGNNVAYVTMNRPDKRNALSTGLKQALMAHFHAAEADDDVTVVVLRGNGKTFCAGADISPDPSKDDRKGDGLKTHAHHLWTLGFHFTPWELTKPVVASVQGHAMGAGCELAMMCDLTIAADTDIFGEPEIRFASVGSAMVMPWIVGHKRSRELLYLGDTIGAERAENIGMINQVVPEAELEAATIRYAERLALVGREALGACKLAVNRGTEAAGFRNALNAGVGMVGLLHVSRVESDQRLYEKVAAEGPAAAFRWRNAQFAK